MPDKRDMHKAKSHRNSKSSSHQPAKPHGQPSAGAPTTMTSIAESVGAVTPETTGKKNKSKR
jgi:hypothetical protein